MRLHTRGLSKIESARAGFALTVHSLSETSFESVYIFDQFRLNAGAQFVCADQFELKSQRVRHADARSRTTRSFVCLSLCLSHRVRQHEQKKKNTLKLKLELTARRREADGRERAIKIQLFLEYYVSVI